MANENVAVTLSDNVRQEIDAWLNKYPSDKKRSAVIQALHFVQNEQGWIPQPMMDAIADYLEIPKIAVYEVATFYDMYHLKPVGQHVISLCTNVSCMLCGSENIAEHLQGKLGIGFGETTSDGKFTLEEVECLAACTGAPAALIDKKYYENLTPTKVDEILEDIGRS